MRLLLAIAIPHLLAVLCFPLLTRRGWLGKLALTARYLPIALSPCLIPVRKPLPRALAAVNAVVLAVKLFDVRRDVQRGAGPDRAAFVTFLLNPFVHVRRCLPAEPRPSVAADLLSVAGGCSGWWRESHYCACCSGSIGTGVRSPPSTSAR